MTTTIARKYTLQCAHFLPNVPENHKCGRVHGHNYRITIYARGEVEPDKGWICDFSEIDVIWSRACGWLDHGLLNDHIQNPTAENMAAWILREMRKTEWIDMTTRPVVGVRVEENDRSWAEVWA